MPRSRMLTSADWIQALTEDGSLAETINEGMEARKRVAKLEELASCALRTDGTEVDRCCECDEPSQDEDGRHYACVCCGRPVCNDCEERLDEQIFCPRCYAFHCRCSTCLHWHGGMAEDGVCGHPEHDHCKRRVWMGGTCEHWERANFDTYRMILRHTAVIAQETAEYLSSRCEVWAEGPRSEKCTDDRVHGGKRCDLWNLCWHMRRMAEEEKCRR